MVDVDEPQSKPQLPLWPFATALGAVAAILLIAGAWVLHLSHDASHQLSLARNDIASLRTEVRTDKTTQIASLERDLQTRAGRAEADSRDPLWGVSSHLPLIGNDLTVARGLAGVADDVATNILPSLTAATNGLRPDAIRGADGSIDLARVAAVGTAVRATIPALAQAQRRLAKLQQRVNLNDIARARAELGLELGDAQESLHLAGQALTLLPIMLGATGPQHYFLVFQNLAEARGTGGLMGSYGVLTADHGTLTLDQAGAGSTLDAATTTLPDSDEPGGDFDQTWDAFEPLRDYFVSNLSPNFPDAGQLIADHASAQLHEQIDGVIAIDPLTLAALLGPDKVRLSDGTVVTGTTVARVTESDLYIKYGENSPIRKSLLTELAKQAFTELKTAPGSRVLSALKSSIGAGRVQIWSSHPYQESILATTDLGGVLPATPGPFAWVGVNNTGPKTDFWLDRSLTYVTGTCPSPKDPDQTRFSEIDLTLTDRVPPGQADVVAHDENDPSAPYGRGHSYVSVYAPVGALFAAAKLNGNPVDVTTSYERGHLVMSLDLYEPDGQPQNLAFTFTEPASGQPSSWRPQPLARPEVVTDDAYACR